MLVRRVQWMGRRPGVVLHLFDEQHWVVRCAGFLLSLDARYGFSIEYGTFNYDLMEYWA